jgi:hypothetical protein
MSDVSRGPGWWLASDGKWYPPHLHPDYRPTPPAPAEAAATGTPASSPGPVAAVPPRRAAPPSRSARARRRRRRRWSLAVGGIVVAAVVAVIVAATVIGGSKTPSTPTGVAGSTGPSATVPRTTTSAPPTISTTVSATSTVVLTVSGSGRETTSTFTAPSPWAMAWRFSCNTGTRQSFDVTVRGENAGTDRPLHEVAIDGAGTEHYHDGGRVHLFVDTPCSWKLTVTG